MDAPSRGKQTSCGPAGCPVTSPPGPQQPLHCTSALHQTSARPTLFIIGVPSNSPFSIPTYFSLCCTIHEWTPKSAGFSVFYFTSFFPPSPVSDSNRPRSRQPEAALFLRERSGVGAGGADLASGSGDVSSGISGTTEVWPFSVLVPAVGTPLALLQVGHPHHLPNDRMGCRLSALPRRLKHISILLLSAVHEHAQRRPELGAYGEGGNMVIRRGQSFH